MSDSFRHEFACPDCGLSCILTQQPGDAKASMQHQLPTCKTYERTKGDGQTFLDLAFLTRNEALRVGSGSDEPSEAKA